MRVYYRAVMRVSVEFSYTSRLVKFTRPLKHVDAKLMVDMHQVDEHPVFSDEAILKTPKIKTSQFDFLSRRWEPQPATNGQRLPHIWPPRLTYIIAFSDPMGYEAFWV